MKIPAVDLTLAVGVGECPIQDMARPKRPRDTKQPAKAIVDQATTDPKNFHPPEERRSADQSPGSRGESAPETSGRS